MSDFDRHSRLNKFEKRRKNTKTISILLVIGSILLIILLGMWLFGGNDKASKSQKEESDIVIKESKSDDNTKDNLNDEDTSSEEAGSNEEHNDDEKNEENNEVETEQIETSGEENVVEAYTGNWQPVGTQQGGPHTTNYNEGSQDRIEMEKAIRLATNLEEGNMTTWWLGNGGDQKVIATVSNKDNTENYRVYLSWIDNEGWQPTKVEVLNENDKR